MNPEQLKNIIEAALMVSEKPVSVSQLLAIFEKETDRPERADIKTAIEQIMQDYEGRGIELKEVSSGYRVQVNGDYADWINHLFDDRPPRYSRALLETLAIIAYRQPVTRAEIEEIRGVSVSSNIIRTLQERSWIRVVGQRDIPGKPELLATTKEFLDYFNLKKLSELPSLSEIKDFDQINPDLFEELEKEARNEVARNDLAKNELARAEMAGQQIEPDEQAVNSEDETSSETEELEEEPEEQTEVEEDAINEEDNVVPFG
ncbi:MAG: SMC-Scp complex subunit ScpB [Gammaproteobacteria bacterium]|nr:MAG: SMC-Scp complex subunit ScpB [Gammaproteobacteria bacterium]